MSKKERLTTIEAKIDHLEQKLDVLAGFVIEVSQKLDALTALQSNSEITMLAARIAELEHILNERKLRIDTVNDSEKSSRRPYLLDVISLDPDQLQSYLDILLK